MFVKYYNIISAAMRKVTAVKVLRISKRLSIRISPATTRKAAAVKVLRISKSLSIRVSPAATRKATAVKSIRYTRRDQRRYIVCSAKYSTTIDHVSTFKIEKAEPDCHKPILKAFDISINLSRLYCLT